MDAYRSPLLDLPDAVASEGPPDAGVAAHYGDPLREQRQLAEGLGFVDLSHRAVIRVSGPDRLSWLHNLTTQKLDALAAGSSAEALILAVPHETLLSRVDAQADAVSGRQVFVPRAELMAFATADDRLGPAAGVLALEALRVEAGRPRFGVDTDHRTIPHEMGWIGSAVKLDKGCYRGQETVARVANLGRPPRRLVRLHLDGTETEQLPPADSEVLLDEAVVGRVTTAAYHYELGPIALAVVKYTTPDDARLVVRTSEVARSATLEAIVERDDAMRPGQAARAAFRVR